MPLLRDDPKPKRARKQCPYCGGVMEPGTIDSTSPIDWSRGSNEHIELDYHLWAKCSVKGDLCRRCKKIILDISGLLP